MSDALIIGLASIIAGILGTALSLLITWWINKNKENASTKLISADTDLKSGELVAKWRGIVDSVTDDNIELASQLKIKDGENKTIMQEFKKLRMELDERDKKYSEEILELKKEFEDWRDWANRLVLQLRSWNLVPVPFDVEAARKAGVSLGEFGKVDMENKND